MPRARLFGIILVATFIALFSAVLIVRSSSHFAQADAPHEGLDFSIGADVNGDGVDDCDTSGGATSCYTTSDSVIATVYLNGLGDLESYRGFAALIGFDGMGSKSATDVLWPDCRSRVDGGVLSGGGSFSLFPQCKEPNDNMTSQYVGPLVRFEAFCTPGGTLRLRHGPVPIAGGSAQTMVVDGKGVTHSETGHEDLAISCASTPTPYPTSTSTPVPPTPTPCPSKGCPPLDFAIGIDVDGDGTNDCGTGVPLAVGDGAPDPVPIEVTNTDCTADADAELGVRVYLMDNGGISYAGFDSLIDYAGLSLAGSPAFRWDSCGKPAFAMYPTSVAAACAGGIGAPASTSVGILVSYEFVCSFGGEISLRPGVGATDLVDYYSIIAHAEDAPDALLVTCGDRTPAPPLQSPSPTPTDTRVPTPTPCPLCPSPTPKPTATPCLACPSPQFAIGIDVDGNGTNDCGTGVPRNLSDGAPDGVDAEVANTGCSGVTGDSFTVNVYLTNTDGLQYAGQSSHVYYQGLVSLGRGVAMWGGCVYSATAYGPYFKSTTHFENVGCAIGSPPAISVSDLGLVSRFTFTCVENGTVWLGHGIGETSLTDQDLDEFREQGGSDVLTVGCGEKLPFSPGDSNCDGTVNAIDAAVILQFGAGLMPILPCKAAADVNHDGRINSIDAALILQSNAGLCQLLELCS